MCLYIKEENYGPGEIIFSRNKEYKPKLYFIHRGEVEIYKKVGNGKNDKAKPFERLYKNNFFGSNEFYT